MDGVKKSLPRKFSTKDQRLFSSKLKKELFVEASLLRVGLPVLEHGIKTMQLSCSISKKNSFLANLKEQFT